MSDIANTTTTWHHVVFVLDDTCNRICFARKSKQFRTANDVFDGSNIVTYIILALGECDFGWESWWNEKTRMWWKWQKPSVPNVNISYKVCYSPDKVSFQEQMHKWQWLCSTNIRPTLETPTGCGKVKKKNSTAQQSEIHAKRIKNHGK